MSDLDKLLERADRSSMYRGDSDAQLIYDLAAAVRKLRETVLAHSPWTQHDADELRRRAEQAEEWNRRICEGIAAAGEHPITWRPEDLKPRDVEE